MTINFALIISSSTSEKKPKSRERKVQKFVFFLIEEVIGNRWLEKLDIASMCWIYQ